MLLIGVSMIFGPDHNGGPAPVSQILVGVFVLVLTLPVVVSMIKGYRLTVADDRVVAHGVINRVYSASSTGRSAMQA